MCAIFGLIDYNSALSTRAKEKILKVLSKECEARGTDATGFAFNNGSHLTVYKRPQPAHKVKLRLPENVKVVMGHTRLSTQGSEKFNFNNHPFIGRTKEGSFALAHNGVLSNDELLRKTKGIPKSLIETDSYIAVQLLEQAGELNFDSLQNMAEDVIGSFVFTVLDDKDNIYFVRGNNPLCIYNFEYLGIYLYASTKEILDRAVRKLGLSRLSKTEIPVSYGDILKIDSFGSISRSTFDSWGYLLGGFYDCEEEYTFGGYQLQQLKEFARCFGIDERWVEDLYLCGYTADEIEELLYEPDEMAAAINMLDYEELYC